MKSFLMYLFCCGLGLLVSACGSGSGGVSVLIGPTPTDEPASTFQRWSSVNPPATVEMAGISQETSYASVAVPPPIFAFEDEGVDTGAMVSLEFGAAGDVERIEIQTANSNFLWDIDQGDLVNDSSKRAILSDSDGVFVGAYLQPLDLGVGWEYQTLGVWETGRGTGSGLIGGVSMGAPTAGDDIPVTGDVTFAGETMGLYIAADGSDYLTYSDLTVDVDFANLGLGLDLFSTNTRKILVDDLPASVGASDSTLDFAGTLAYDSDANTFSGAVSGLNLIGTSTGQFYGPNAEELGGVFTLTGGDGGHYSGAYGAAR